MQRVPTDHLLMDFDVCELYFFFRRNPCESPTQTYYAALCWSGAACVLSSAGRRPDIAIEHPPVWTANLTEVGISVVALVWPVELVARDEEGRCRCGRRITRGSSLGNASSGEQDHQRCLTSVPPKRKLVVQGDGFTSKAVTKKMKEWSPY